jgi:hypothetical protein
VCCGQGFVPQGDLTRPAPSQEEPAADQDCRSEERDPGRQPREREVASRRGRGGSARRAAGRRAGDAAGAAGRRLARGLAGGPTCRLARGLAGGLARGLAGGLTCRLARGLARRFAGGLSGRFAGRPARRPIALRADAQIAEVLVERPLNGDRLPLRVCELVREPVRRRVEAGQRVVIHHDRVVARLQPLVHAGGADVLTDDHLVLAVRARSRACSRSRRSEPKRGQHNHEYQKLLHVSPLP